jgi:type I restriction enzyme S subunit
VLPEYVLAFLKSPHFLLNGESRMTGSAGQRRVPWDYFAHTLFALPPLTEQKRIVAKVEELLALCDELEARQSAAREHRTRLVRSALDRLPTANGARLSSAAAAPPHLQVSELAPAPTSLPRAAGEDTRAPQDAFPHPAAFVLNAFPDLTATPEDVPALRQAILSLAVQGRLVPRNAKEGMGADAIERFSLRAILDDGQILDEIFPDHWAITAFSNLARIRSGVTKDRKLAGRKTAAFPYLRVANVQRGRLDLDLMKDIEIPVEELEKYRLESNDLLITEGGDWDKVGRTAIWREEIPDCIHQNHVFRARLVRSALDRLPAANGARLSSAAAAPPHLQVSELAPAPTSLPGAAGEDTRAPHDAFHHHAA